MLSWHRGLSISCALQLLIVSIKSSFSQLPGYNILKTVYCGHQLWSSSYNSCRWGRLSRLIFVLSAVMNNNAAFYYIQRKHLFFTRHEGERGSVHTHRGAEKPSLVLTLIARERGSCLWQEGKGDDIAALSQSNQHPHNERFALLGTHRQWRIKFLYFEEEQPRQRWLVYSAKVSRCCFFEDWNWFNWEENCILCPNSKHLWGDQTGRYYTWSIKKPKLSKMNSTCSMKAWHRCVSLWGPPGRLCTASWVVETGFKSAFLPLHSYCNNKLVGCTYAFCETIWAPRACWQHFTCVYLKAKGSTAVTLVPIAPPGGKAERSAECSLQLPNSPEVVKPHQGEKPFKWSRCGRRAGTLS